MCNNYHSKSFTKLINDLPSFSICPATGAEYVHFTCAVRSFQEFVWKCLYYEHTKNSLERTAKKLDGCG